MPILKQFPYSIDGKMYGIASIKIQGNKKGRVEIHSHGPSQHFPAALGPTIR